MNKRTYTMGARAEKVEASRNRILAAAQEQFVSPDDDLTLESVAAAAGVSVRTVLRAFGTREGLIVAAIDTMREDTQRTVDDPPATPVEAVERLFDDYENIGDRVIRMLADEHRVPGFAAVAAEGRARHRDWVVAAFAAQLRGLRGRARTAAIDALVTATDIYVWKLLRRDLGRTRAEAEQVVLRLVHTSTGS